MQTFVDKDSFRIINLKRIHPNIWTKLEEFNLQNYSFILQLYLISFKFLIIFQSLLLLK